MIQEFKRSRLTHIKHEKGILYRSESQKSLIRSFSLVGEDSFYALGKLSKDKTKIHDISLVIGQITNFSTKK